MDRGKPAFEPRFRTIAPRRSFHWDSCRIPTSSASFVEWCCVFWQTPTSKNLTGPDTCVAYAERCDWYGIQANRRCQPDPPVLWHLYPNGWQDRVSLGRLPAAGLVPQFIDKKAKEGTWRTEFVRSWSWTP